jgi:glycosyltransferase involved in cell wall biosynthesis
MTSGVSVVIPSIKDDVLTLGSVPEDVPVSIEREGTLNEARNRGVRHAEHDAIAILDDDISFSESLFDDLIGMVDDQTVVGAADWEFGLLAGRVILFHRDVWRDVGGFDERLRSHNGDTDFSIKIHDAGYDLVRFPREIIRHEEHSRSITTRDRAWRLAYLCGKHPEYAPHLLASTAAYNVTQWTGVDYKMAVPRTVTDETWSEQGKD